MTSSQTSPMPHIIPDVIPFIMAQFAMLASGDRWHVGVAIKTQQQSSDDVKNRSGIINVHGNNATIGANPAPFNSGALTRKNHRDFGPP